MSRLPSLTALRAFEAAVRHKSMRAAADELCVTHGAVSRHVRSLEEEFGFPLFYRSARAITPTEEGARLAVILGDGFGIIAEGIRRLRPGPIVVSCAASLMTRWLIPRLRNFKNLHPSIDLRLSAGLGPVDMGREGISVVVRNDGVKPPPGAVVKPIMREQIGLVCSPEYARDHDFKSADDLPRLYRLSTHSRPDAWDDWSTSYGLVPPSLEPHEEFSEFYLLFQAAECGLGVAIGIRYLVEEDLRSGRLVAPLGFVQGRHQVVLWTLPQTDARAGIQVFIDWFREEMLQTVQA
jgi:LysR family transcriptional regulator, glycine cleavage system transcriptional activator